MGNYLWSDLARGERAAVAAIVGVGGAAPSALKCPLRGAFWQLRKSSTWMAPEGVTDMSWANAFSQDYSQGYKTPDEFWGDDVSEFMVPIAGIDYFLDDSTGNGFLGGIVLPAGVYYVHAEWTVGYGFAPAHPISGQAVVDGNFPTVAASLSCYSADSGNTIIRGLVTGIAAMMATPGWLGSHLETDNLPDLPDAPGQFEANIQVIQLAALS